MTLTERMELKPGRETAIDLQNCGIRSPNVEEMYLYRVDGKTVFYFFTEEKREKFIRKHLKREKKKTKSLINLILL